MTARVVTGTLVLVPNTLDFGSTGEPGRIDALLPGAVLRRAAGLSHWVAENAKTTRAFLRRVDAVVSLAQPLQSLAIVELPRPQKGRPTLATPGLDALLDPARASPSSATCPSKPRRGRPASASSRRFRAVPARRS